MTYEPITRFIGRNHITMTVERLAERMDGPSSDWDAQASHWRCTLRIGRKRLTVPYSMGSAHHGEPKLRDVLDCMASDSDAPQDFEEWCDNFGYDSDSRKAERIYKAIERQTHKLITFLGDEEYQKLLYEVERL